MTQTSRTSRSDRRRQLARAARAVLARDGLRGLTTRAVTAEAGTSLASLHYAYASVDDLLSEVLDTSLSVIREQVVRDVRPVGSLAEAVDGCLRRLWAVVLADEALQVQQYELTLHLLRHHRADLGARQYRGYVAIVEDYLTAAVPDGSGRAQASVTPLARFIAAALDGLILQHLVEPDADRTAADLAQLRAAVTAMAAVDPDRNRRST